MVRRLDRFLLGCLFFSGCVKIPEKDLAQMSDLPTMKQSVERAYQTKVCAPGEWPMESWWELFNDDQLTDLIVKALEKNPLMLRADAQVELALQMALQQRSSLFPEVDANFLENWQYLSPHGLYRAFFPTPPGTTLPATINQLDLTLNFSWELDFWGKNKKLFKAALDRKMAEEAERAQTALIISTLVAQGYFELQNKLGKKRLLEKRIRSQLSLNLLREEKTKGGLANDLPPLQSSADALLLKNMLTLLEQGIESDKNNLRALLGEGPDCPLDLCWRGEQLLGPIPLPKEIEIDLLHRRPDLTALIWRVESAAKEIGAAKTEFYPNIKLGAFMGLESLKWGNFFSWNSRTGALVPALHLPIFTAGRIKAQLMEKVALFNTAVQDYNQLILDACRQVADQLISLQKIEEQLEIQSDRISNAEDQFRLEAIRYTGGLGTYLPVLRAEENVLAEEAALLDRQRDQWMAALLLIKALGGGYQR